MTNPKIDADTVKMADEAVERAAREAVEKKQAEEFAKAVRTKLAYDWVMAMHRAFKGISGAPSKAGLVGIAREKFNV